MFPVTLCLLICLVVDSSGLHPELRIQEDSRPPLGAGSQAMVGIVAVLIILANTMLCTFIFRDGILWSLVSLLLT